MDIQPHIDFARLQKQLADRGYDGSFEHLQFEFVGRFSTELWQLQPVGPAAGQMPLLVVKNPYQDDRTGESADLESMFYDQVAVGVPVLVPPYIGRQGDMLILEWVSDLEHFDFKSGPVAGHAELAMDGYAALHAAMWNDVGHFNWLPQLADVALRDSFQADFDLGWKANRKEFDELCPSFTAIGDALMGRLAKTLEGLAFPQTFLHGDGHAENLPMTSTGGIVFLDWQAPRAENPGFDIAVFMAMSYPVESRRVVEEKLVCRHYESVRNRGIDWPDPFSDYRLGLLRRAARIVEISVNWTPSSLPWIFKRCATAAADHGVGDLIV